MLLERRSAARYPLVLNVRYHTVRKGSNHRGAGRTVNISSSGLLIASDHLPSDGMWLEAAVEWPALLDGQVGLQLVAVGRVVWIQPSAFALSFSQYGFRTTKRRRTGESDAAGHQFATATAGTSGG